MKHKLQLQVEEPGTLTLRIPVATPTVDDGVCYEYSTEFFADAVLYGDKPDGSIFHPYSWIITDDGGIYLLHIYSDGTVSRLEIPERERPYFEGIRDDRKRMTNSIQTRPS
jgi:hypothetical protein